MALVLCVDDDLTVARIMADVARYCRHEAAVETNSIEAVSNWIHADRLAAVITDYMMPKMDGIELLSIVRDVRPEVRRILITSAAKDTTVQRAEREGLIQMLIIKPPTIGDLQLALAWL